MADDLDILGARLGIPAQLLPAWKKQVAPAAATPPAAPQLRPGDPGWSLAPAAAPMPAPSPPRPVLPAGPRPGDPGFNITQLAPAAPPPPSKPLPVAPPSKPMTPEQKRAADLAAIQGTNEEIAKINSTPKGTLVLEGASGMRAYDAAKGTEENIKKAVKDEDARQNIAGATFHDGGEGSAMAGVAGAGRPFLISPGGRREHSWAVQEGRPVGDEEKDAARSAEDHGRTAAGLDYMAGQKQAEYERGYLERFEQAHTERQRGLEDRSKAYEAEYGKHVAELDKLRGEIRSAKIDPLGGLGGAGRFASAVAIALGAFGSKRGENAGLEAVKFAIGENIRRGEEQINKIERGMKGETTFLGQLKSKYGDIEHAKDAAWIGYLERAKVEMAKILGSEDVRDPKLQAQYERALKQVDEELELRLNKWDERTRDKVVRHDINAPPQYGGLGGGKSAGDPLFVPTGPNGEGFRARSEKEAQAARGVVAAEQDVVPMLERLIMLREQTNAGERLANSKGLYESERMAQIKSLQGQVALKLRELSATSPGAMDKGMQELAGQIQGDWTSTQGHPEAAANEFIRSVRRQKDSLMRGQGGQSERQRLTYDQKGNITTQSVGQPKFASPKGEMPGSFKDVR